MTNVGDMFDIRTGFTFRDSIASIKPGSVTVIQAGDINAHKLANAPRIEFKGDKHLLKTGDILLSARGSTTARVVTDDILPAVAASSVIVLRPKHKLNSKFVARFFNSPIGQAAFAKIMSGSYIKTLRKIELSTLVIPLPTVSTQELIVDLSDVLESYQQTMRLKEELLTDIFNQAIKLGGSIR